MLFIPDTVIKGQENLVRSLIAACAISALMGLYRLVVTLFMMDQMYRLELYNNAFAILALAGISLWCARYLVYRLKDVNHIKDYRIMKYVSLFAAVCCFLRVVTAGVYFSVKMDGGGAITYIYVVADILLWAVLTVFFFAMWNEKRKKEKKRLELKAKGHDGQNG